MNQLDVRHACQATAGNVDAGYATADDCHEHKAVQDVRQPALLGSLDRNHEWRAKCPRGTDEVLIIVWNTHAHEPYVEDEEHEHSPEHWVNGSFDGLPRFLRFTCIR